MKDSEYLVREVSHLLSLLWYPFSVLVETDQGGDRSGDQLLLRVAGSLGAFSPGHSDFLPKVDADR